MAKTAAWGGQVELLALSRILNRPIEVREERRKRRDYYCYLGRSYKRRVLQW